MNSLRRLPCAITLLVALLASTAADAQTLLLKDGQRIEGHIVSQDPHHVTIETSSGGIAVRQRIARSQIQSIIERPREGVGYAMIPLRGDVGIDITAAGLQQAFHEARRSGAQFVVLLFDTPGGYIAEERKILEVIRANRDLRLIAYVRQAVSAGALIALMCPEIYMHPEGTIGARVGFNPALFQAPELVLEKMQSADRAYLRSVAAIGGHSELWIRGMSEADLELIVHDVDGRPVLAEATAGAEGRIIKRNGQILTLNAREATEYGLATGIAPGMESLRAHLQQPAWHEADNRAAWRAMEQHGRETRRLYGQEQRRRERETYLKDVEVDLIIIETRIGQARSVLAAANEALDKLQKQHRDELATINREHEQATRNARASGDTGHQMVQAEHQRRTRTEMLNHRIKSETTHYETMRTAAEKELAELNRRKQDLLDKAPRL